MPIRILDAQTVGRIAAGEVVERPSSVAKELFENSLDAKATSITVEIRSGGIEYLRVTDNGCGINPEEVKLAFQNHATSKIQTAEELTDIRTMGFRGEALASISAVSKVELTTRRRGADAGVKAVVEAGRFVSFSEVGCPEGTTVVVRDLFFNTPVRKTFLKKPNYEAGAVIETVTKLLLGNPNVSVRMLNAGKTLFHSFGDGNLRHAALAVYGNDVAGALLDVDAMQGGLRLKGLIGVGDQARQTRSQQSFFINGRSIRCQMVSQALENATSGRVTVGAHPMCILNITLPQQSVDVNVHPSKLEVRFRDEEAMRASLESAFASAFQKEKMLNVEAVEAEKPSAENKARLTVESVPQKSGVKEKESVETPVAEQAFVMPVTSLNLREGADVRREPEEQKPPRDDVPVDMIKASAPVGTTDEKPSVEPERPKPVKAVVSPVEMENIGAVKPLYRIIGSAFDTYLLIQTDNALVMIDQHAAHERILYERYSSSLMSGTASQKLLLPLVIELSRKELAQIENAMELISDAGFDVEAFGEREIVIRAVPFILGKSEIKPLFMNMLDRLDQLKYAEAERRRQEIMQMACKHAIKGSQSLSNAEIEELINLMTQTDAPATCPHGRPVLRSFTKTELDKMFKRIQ